MSPLGNKDLKKTALTGVSDNHRTYIAGNG